MKNQTNALPLLLTISETCIDDSTPPSTVGRIIHAAVHGWMEGHLAAPGHKLDPTNIGEMPDAPFPDPSDRRLKQIIEETETRFAGEKEEAAAVCFAAALGWQAGRQAGMDCPGCATVGWDTVEAKALRGGTAEVLFRMPGAMELAVASLHHHDD